MAIHSSKRWSSFRQTDATPLFRIIQGDHFGAMNHPGNWQFYFLCDSCPPLNLEVLSFFCDSSYADSVLKTCSTICMFRSRIDTSLLWEIQGLLSKSSFTQFCKHFLVLCTYQRPFRGNKLEQLYFVIVHYSNKIYIKVLLTSNK